MILPDIDVETATDEEIIAAYLKDGFDEEYARFCVDVLRGRVEPVD